MRLPRRPAEFPWARAPEGVAALGLPPVPTHATRGHADPLAGSPPCRQAGSRAKGLHLGIVQTPIEKERQQLARTPGDACVVGDFLIQATAGLFGTVAAGLLAVAAKAAGLFDQARRFDPRRFTLSIGEILLGITVLVSSHRSSLSCSSVLNRGSGEPNRLVALE
jgi:hypothetical protein